MEKAWCTDQFGMAHFSSLQKKLQKKLRGETHVRRESGGAHPQFPWRSKKLTHGRKFVG